MTHSSDLVATWDLALSDGVHKVEFEHGTTSGKRVIRVDGMVRDSARNHVQRMLDLLSLNAYCI